MQISFGRWSAHHGFCLPPRLLKSFSHLRLFLNENVLQKYDFTRFLLTSQKSRSLIHFFKAPHLFVVSDDRLIQFIENIPAKKVHFPATFEIFRPVLFFSASWLLFRVSYRSFKRLSGQIKKCIGQFGSPAKPQSRWLNLS